MRKSALVIIGLFALTPATYGDDQDNAQNTPPNKASGRDVYGKPLGTDVQGNPNDKNAQGSRPKDVWGNPPKDMYGNKTGTEN